MKKTKFHRLLAFALAFCFLIGGMFTVTVAADTASSDEKDTLAQIREELNAVSYEEYKNLYFKDENGVPRAESSITILGQDYDVDATTGDVTVKTDANTGEVLGLYTPGDGSVTWDVPGITTPVRFSVIIEYWPDSAKSTSIERVLKINGKIPFAEARYVTLPKIWVNNYPAAKVTAKNMTPEQLYTEATTTGGFTADQVAVKDGYLEVQIPDTWTAANTAFVEKYTVRFMKEDLENNELRPEYSDVPEWRNYELRDNSGFYVESFEFVFEPGENGKTTITLESVCEPMTIKSIKLVPHEDYKSYADYLATLSEVERQSGKDTILIQNEYNFAASTQTVYPIEDRSDAATLPCDTTRVVLNTIGGEKWQTAGQWLRYSFKVSSSGMYDIAARFRQNVLDGMYVNRALYIYSGEGVAKGEAGYYDGIPFTEAGQFRFNYGGDWQSSLMNATDKEGNLSSCAFYFKEGVTYDIEIEVTIGSMGDIVRRVETALKAINNDYLSILKLTGASPDEYRDYGFSRIMPEVMIDMLVQADEFESISLALEKITGGKSSNTATLDKIVNTLRIMGGDEDQIAKYLSQLKSYIGSLGTWLSDAKTQPLQLDYIVIQPLESELPQATAGFFASLIHEVKSFFMSFFRNYNEMGSTGDDAVGAGSIDVWIATGRDQAQVLRTLINDDFSSNPEIGCGVNLQLVAGGTLLPSVLAGMGPDVYIGVGEDTVINYAIRGALLPIENMPDFADFALEYEVDENFQKVTDANGEYIFNPNAQFNEAAMIVMGIEDNQGKFHYYGLPEAQGFSMMFLRKDVLAELDINIPKTWDDILEAVPVLQANNMEIGMHQDYKIFLYQMGGELFADDGMRINLDSNMGLEAFDTMCSYFTMYSFPVSYDFANRFRTGEMPIGFASYTGTYNQLVVFATEIDGLWEFYEMPGLYVYDKDGNPVIDETTGEQKINNVVVSASSAIVMMADGYGDVPEDELPEEIKAQRLRSWEFMKWHVGAKCQKDYANEMVAIMGPSAKHSTANKFALAEMPWTTTEYQRLEAQFKNLASIPNYPGSYIIGRYTNFAFLAAYNDNANPIVELQSYISTINKEITRKRAEFGLETLELGQTLLEKRLLQVEEAYEQDVKDMSDSQIAAAAAALQMMKDGIRKENAEMLDSAAKMFAEVNATGFARTITALQKAETVMRKYQQ